MWKGMVLKGIVTVAVTKSSFTASLKLSLGKTKQSGKTIKRKTEEPQ